MTDEIPQWAKVRACELANAERDMLKCWQPSHVDHWNGTLYALAKHIAEHEPAPVDPLLVEAREIVASKLDYNGFHLRAAEIRRGSEDKSSVVKCTLAGLRRGMEMVK